MKGGDGQGGASIHDEPRLSTKGERRRRRVKGSDGDDDGCKAASATGENINLGL